jgi:hypothetical protein
MILSHQPECKLEAGGKSKCEIDHVNAKYEIDDNCFWLLLGL